MGNQCCQQPISQPQIQQILFKSQLSITQSQSSQSQIKIYESYKKQLGIQQIIGINLKDLTQIYVFFDKVNENKKQQYLSQKYSRDKQNNRKRLSKQQYSPTAQQFHSQRSIKQIQSAMFQINKNIKKKLTTLTIKQQKSKTNQLPDCYYLTWLSLNKPALYIGQWKYQNYFLCKNVPYGIGRLYFNDWIYEGQIQTYFDENLLSKEQLKNMIHKEIDINKKIQILTKYLIIKINGQGRKFNKKQEFSGQFENGILNGKALYKNYQLQYSYQGQWNNNQKHGKGIQKTKFTLYQGLWKHNQKYGYGSLTFYISAKHQKQRQQQQKIIQHINQNDKQYKLIKLRTKRQQELQQIVQKKINQSIKQSYKTYKWQNPFQLYKKNNKLRDQPNNNFFTMQNSFFIDQQQQQQSSLLNINVQNLKYQQRIKSCFLQKYVGSFKQDNFHGKGSYQWYNGNFYNGQWLQGKMNGVGQFYWKSGYSYKGQYKNDLKHGKGQMIWNPYRRYRGDWAYGNKHGYGQQIKIVLNKQKNNLNILLKGSLWKNNHEEKNYFIKQIPIIGNIYQKDHKKLITEITFYNPKQQLQKHFLIQLYGDQFNFNPCLRCGQYYKKQQSKLFNIDQLNNPNKQINLDQLCQECFKQIEKVKKSHDV